jgi:7-carboxy-7-deazaguanine synthase
MAEQLVIAKLGEGPEIFHSIQGEGFSSGVPSVFVRLSGCNLQCVWCDTDYTWNFEGTPYVHQNDQRPGYRKFVRAEVQCRLRIEEAAEAILGYPCRNVIFTGGEPLLQSKPLVELMTCLRTLNADFRFDFETNGTRFPEPAIESFAPRYNVSPKLANSGMPVEQRLKPQVLDWFAACPRATFKFVCQREEDLAEVQALVGQAGLPVERVFLMPEATTRELLAERRGWLISKCLAHGFRYSDRLHVSVWGARRGV